MESTFTPFLLVIFASLFQGSFGLGMKYMAPLKWEAWWLVHVTIAMILFPIAWSLIAVPDLINIIATSPLKPILLALLFGFLWGIGGIMFGVSVPYIGLSLTYGIVMGLASSVGGLIPFFRMGNALEDPKFPYVITGVSVMLIGVAITAVAGIKRDKVLNTGVKGSNIGKGLIIASICGVLSALLNVGFDFAQPIALNAREAGVVTRNSSLAAWVVVLLGAYLMNAGYSIFLLIRNRSWSSFSVEASGKAYLWAIVAGLFWFAALGVYGQGAVLLGEIGPVIGWPILLGLSLIISNIWAFLSGEWKGASKQFRLLLAGLLVLILASVILGYANQIG